MKDKDATKDQLIKELKQSEERYRNLVESSPDGILTIDTKGFVTSFNTAFCKLTGFPKEEYIGKHFGKLPTLNKRDIPKILKLFASVIVGKKVKTPLVFAWIHKDGTERLGEYYYSLIRSQGKIKGVQVVARDITERKQVEEVLRKSEEKFRNLHDTMTQGVIYQDKTGKVISMNPAAKRILDTGLNEIVDVPTINKNLQTIREDGSEYKAKDHPTMVSIRTGKPVNNAIMGVYIHGEDTYRWINISTVPQFKIGEENPYQVFVTFIDVTEHKQAEEALRESEERFRRVFEEGPLGMTLVNLDRSYLDVNHRFCEMLGYTKQELMSRTFADITHPEHRDVDKENVNRLKKGEIPYYRTEKRYIKKNGEVIWCDTTATIIRNGGGTPLYFLAMAQDITDRKHAEKALRESEEKYRSLFSRARDGIVIVDRGTGSIADCNPEYERQTGRTCKQLKSMKIWEIKPPDMVQKTKAQFFKIKEQGSGGSTESTYLRPDGTILPYEFSATSINIKGKRYLYGITRDISERKQLEEQHQKAAKLESVGILAGGIAHDFNNLLTGVIGNISLAKRNLERGELDKVSARLEDAERASVRSKDLTQQLLTFAKGGLPIKQLVDLKGVIKQSATFALRGSNIKPVFSIQDDLSAVEVDEGQINQVLSNLLINANEAMPDGGTVEVGARNVSTKEMSTSLLPGGDYIEVSVKDHGIGISEKHMSKIFDPYFTTKQKGSGLGLATAYSIVKNHGGDITVESKLGVGTTFYIYLPASKKRLPVKKETAAKTPLTGRGRILVMDDEDIIKRLLFQELTGIGHEVELSSDGAEAIKLYKQAQTSGRPFDVVILDLTVPGGMGGKQTIKELLEIDPEVKAIVSSGYATDPIMAEFKKYGFKGVVAKPYNATQLEETLHELLRNTK